MFSKKSPMCQNSSHEWSIYEPGASISVLTNRLVANDYYTWIQCPRCHIGYLRALCHICKIHGCNKCDYNESHVPIKCASKN